MARSPRAAKTPARQSAKKTETAPTISSSNNLRQIASALGFFVLQSSHHKEAKNPEKIRFLTKFGFDRYQIAAMIDSTPGTVSKEQSILRTTKEKEEGEPD